MIAISDIIIFLSGVAFTCVAILTRNHLYGKHISVAGITQVDEAYKTRKVDTNLPEVDKNHLFRLVSEINRSDEFARTHSRRAKARD